MIADLRPYAEYKDSGVPWAEYVPRHWAVQRLKTLASNVTETVAKVHDSSTYIGLKNVESWTGRVATKRIAGSLSGQAKRFPVGAVLFAKLRPYLAKAVCAERAGVCSGEFLVLIASRMVVAQYLGYALRSPGLIHSITGLTAGARMPRAEWDAIGRLVVPRPSLPEQAAIVRFLDWATRRVDRAIRAKRRLVALLTEQKQAIIHRAVTQGLDPSVPMKESGIPWLGEIPAHWEVRRLGSLLRERAEKNGDGAVTEVLSLLRGRGIIPYAEKGNIGNKRSENITRYKVVQPDDIVLNSMNVIIGSVGISRYVGCLSPVYYVLLVRNTQHSPRYFDAVFQLRLFHQSLVRIGSGILAHRMRIPMELLKCELMPMPPARDQHAIVAHLDGATAGINSTIERTQRQIGLLREYRARLVADVVTGKLDVRAFAETLPDEAPDDIEAIEADVDEDADDDETGDGADEG